MLIFNKESREKGWNEVGAHVPPYTSCPNLKKENINRQTNLSPTSEAGYKQSFTPSAIAPVLITHSQQVPYEDHTRFDYNRYMQQLQQKLGDYSIFRAGDAINRDRMSNFHSQMHGESLSRQAGYPGHQFIGIQDMNGFEDPLSSTQEHQVTAGLQMSQQLDLRNARGFRDKILEKLGNAQLEDSKLHSQSERYSEHPSNADQYED